MVERSKDSSCKQVSKSGIQSAGPESY